MTDTPFPPPLIDTISFDQIVASQIQAIKVINQQGTVIRQLVARIQDMEDMMYKFLGVDDHGRIPGMPGYDGPLKQVVEEYQQLKANAGSKSEPTEENPTGFGVYL